MDQNVKYFASFFFVIGNKNPDLYIEWAHWKKNCKFRPQVTECGVEKEPAGRVHLKQEVCLQLDDCRMMERTALAATGS